MSNLADRYLARIGIDRPTTLNLSALTAVLHAHLRAIPFENIDSFSGKPVSLVPEHCFAKLLEGKRGGYCMEHALLSSAALSALGFEVERSLARVLYGGSDSDVAAVQTHCCCVVRIDGAEYLFDAGFGRGEPSFPIRLDNGDAEQVGQYGSFRVISRADAAALMGANRVGTDVTLVLQVKKGEDWIAMYGLTRRPVVLADIEAFNWFVCTSPGSKFVRTLRGSTWDGDKVATVLNRQFKQGDKTVQAESGEAVHRWLVGEFGLKLDDGQVQRVWERLLEEDGL